MNSASADLVHLDPPFDSNADYAAPIGSQAAGAEFKDTWSSNDVDVVGWIQLEQKYPLLHRILLAAPTISTTCSCFVATATESREIGVWNI